jgi:hypothetical protein
MLIATWVFKALGFDRFHTKFYRNIININIHIDNWIIKIIIKIKIKNMGFIIILYFYWFTVKMFMTNFYFVDDNVDEIFIIL